MKKHSKNMYNFYTTQRAISGTEKGPKIKDKCATSLNSSHNNLHLPASSSVFFFFFIFFFFGVNCTN